MAFSDLLKAPLPSKANAVVESAEEPVLENELDPSIVDDGLSNSEMDALDNGTPEVCPDCGQDPCACDAGAGASDDVDMSDLTPEEDRNIDDILNSIATPILLKDELGDEKCCREFVESTDADIAVAEGFLTEKTIVRFDKNAKKAQLYEVAIYAVAREKKDPLYKKLETVYKMERILKAKLRKKYHTQAMKKMKQYLARAKKSKSNVISRIANKIIGAFSPKRMAHANDKLPSPPTISGMKK